MDTEKARDVIHENTPYTVEHIEHSNRFAIRRAGGEVARNIRFNSDEGMSEAQFLSYAREVERETAERVGNIWERKFRRAARGARV
jgi:hypothetical protein